MGGTTLRRPAAKAPARLERQPATSVDVVLFTVVGDALQALLVRRPRDTDDPFPGRWSLCGGLIDVDVDADLEACARRILLAKAGATSPYLEQLGSWGGARRDPRGWSSTHVYIALVPPGAIGRGVDGTAAEVAWHDAVPAPGRRSGRLAFDHDLILAAAVERLRSKVEYTSLPAFLLAEPFTLPQLQRVYEVVLGRNVDKSGFRTRMLAAPFLGEAGYVAGESKRPAMGYRLRERSRPVVFPRTFGAA